MERCVNGCSARRRFVIPVSSFDACDIDAETLTLLHRNHLRCWLKAELLHHRFEVVLTRALRREGGRGGERMFMSSDLMICVWTERNFQLSLCPSVKPGGRSRLTMPTRLLKVSRPVSWVSRLERNCAPLRDRRTPARGSPSSDLICVAREVEDIG